MAEWPVPEVVAKGDRFHQVFIEKEGLANGPGDLGYLDRMRQSRSVMVIRRKKKDLRLMLQPPERLAVYDPVTIMLKRRPEVTLGLRPQPAPRP